MLLSNALLCVESHRYTHIHFTLSTNVWRVHGRNNVLLLSRDLHANYSISLSSDRFVGLFCSGSDEDWWFLKLREMVVTQPCSVCVCACVCVSECVSVCMVDVHIHRSVLVSSVSVRIWSCILMKLIYGNLRWQFRSKYFCSKIPLNIEDFLLVIKYMYRPTVASINVLYKSTLWPGQWWPTAKWWSNFRHSGCHSGGRGQSGGQRCDVNNGKSVVNMLCDRHAFVPMQDLSRAEESSQSDH